MSQAEIFESLERMQESLAHSADMEAEASRLEAETADLRMIAPIIGDTCSKPSRVGWSEVSR